MIDTLAQIAAWLNLPANALGRFLLAPVGWLPGWLSATIVSAVTGVLLLVIFKYTSHQRAVKRARDDIKAHLLAAKLFKDSMSVTLQAQGRIFVGALRLMIFAIVPMLVMIVPVCLMLGQLALWYQSRPLRIGEEAVVTLKLASDVPSGAESVSPVPHSTRTVRDSSPGGGPDLDRDSGWPDVRLQPTSAAEVTVGPVRVLSNREICWNIKARKVGYHGIDFQVGTQISHKELAIGEGFMRLSAKRPGWAWTDIVLHPSEPPLGPDSPVESIEISYPDRESWTCGTDWWVAYWFILSMVAALCFRPLLKVNI